MAQGVNSRVAPRESPAWRPRRAPVVRERRVGVKMGVGAAGVVWGAVDILGEGVEVEVVLCLKQEDCLID